MLLKNTLYTVSSLLGRLFSHTCTGRSYSSPLITTNAGPQLVSAQQSETRVALVGGGGEILVRWIRRVSDESIQRWGEAQALNSCK